MAGANVSKEKEVVLELMTDEHVRTQLRRQGVRIPLHATASLQRTRIAIMQLAAARMVSHHEFCRLRKRWFRLVPTVVELYSGASVARRFQ